MGGLLYRSRKHDRLAVTRLASAKAANQHNSNQVFETCLFIRIVANLIRDSDPESAQPLIKFLQNCRHSQAMVKFEAAKAICSLEDVLPASAITTAVSMLTSILSGSLPAVRMSALRILNRLKTPISSASCHELETLVSDSNLSVATLAISMLLKTGAESSVESHLKTLGNFMVDISDEFKCNVADAIKNLCLKYPRKKSVLLSFLAKSLRDDGQYEYKSKVVDTIMEIMKEIPASKEEAMLHLCEFIEDCEYADLACRVLYLLGEEGPSAKCASKYIRYIFNRVILENPAVRCAAVQSLGKFGRNCPSLHDRIALLLQRCFGDSHAVVRESALFQYKVLTNSELNPYMDNQLNVPTDNLVSALQTYLSEGSNKPFDINSVPKKVKQQPKKQDEKSGEAPSRPVAFVNPTASNYAAELAKVPELADLGKVLCSSKVTPLTESETEYTVSCVKHMFAEHLVLQFNCINTLNDQLLEEVSVRVEVDSGEFELLEEIPLESLPYDTVGVTYVILQKEANTLPMGSLSCTLKFTAKEIDPSTGEPDATGFEDDYQLEEVEVTIADYMSVWVSPNPQALWDQVGEENQVVEKYALNSFKSLEQACKEIAEFLHMSPCGQTHYQPGVSSKSKHLLFLSGKFMGSVDVVARSRMKLNPNGGVAMELTVRSTNEEINVALCNAL